MRRTNGAGGLLLGLALLAGCSNPTEAADEAARLRRSQRRWDALEVRDYRMTVRMHGAWVGGEAVIEVRGGVPVSLEGVPGGPPVQPAMFEHHDTVEELFRVVRRSLDEEAHRLRAEYHPLVGVPTRVDVDPRAEWADDEHGFAVSRFQILRSQGG